MKKFYRCCILSTLLFASCSDEYDDSALTGRVDNLENRVAKLEELCKQMNTNISSLQTIVTALQKERLCYERDPHHAEWERGWLYDNVQ